MCAIQMFVHLLASRWGPLLVSERAVKMVDVLTFHANIPIHLTFFFEDRSIRV